jgi:predicted phage tail protein
MSGDENNDNTSIMEMIRLMLTNMSNEFNSSVNDINHNMNNNMNSLREDMSSLKVDMNSNNDMVNARIESLQERIASRTNSRAVSPSTLALKLNAKVKMEPIDLATDTPRAYAPREDISMTVLMKSHEDANAFADANPMPKQRKPLESKPTSKRMNTHAWRDSFAAVNRKNNPAQRGTFTTTTPEVTAYLDGPLTLLKCLEFERLLLEYSQRHNIEIRYTNQVSNNLKHEIRARFELTDSQFYDLHQQQLCVYLSEMIAPVTKAEFLKVLRKTVTFTGLPHNYVPTEQNLQTFLQQLMVYKDKLYRAIEFLLLFEGS